MNTRPRCYTIPIRVLSNTCGDFASSVAYLNDAPHPSSSVACLFSKILRNSGIRHAAGRKQYTENLGKSATGIWFGTRNNLAHCFCCQKNLNNIDLLITLGYDFRSAVVILERLLNQYQARMAKIKTPPASTT